MARPKNPATTRPPAARSAAHSAPAPAPVPGTGPAPDGPAAAVRAALAAHPGGATTAIIATAAGIGRPAARDVLTALETDGTVTRTRGGKPGTPDTWALTAPPQPAAGPGGGHDGDGGHPGSAPAASSQDGSGPGEAASSRDGDAPASAGGDPDPAAGQPAQPCHGPAGDGQDDPGQQEPAAGPGRAGAAPASGSNPDDRATGSTAGDGPADSTVPDPALVTEITGRVGQIQAAATAAAAVLAAAGDLRAVLTGMDEICEQATRARRELKAAAGGKQAPPARPGALRDKILAHLRAHPGTDFTPHDLHKVLGNSSGAIANALDTLARHSQAELASDKPRKFRLTPGTPAPAGTQAGEDTELAGAA